MEKKTLYHLTLWRFGGTLEIISDNEETAQQLAQKVNSYRVKQNINVNTEDKKEAENNG